MSLNTWLFPAHSRHFPGQRWTNIGLRTLHLLGVAGLGAGYLYTGADESWRNYLTLTLVSGLGLVLLALWSNGIWLIQLRGQAILLKTGLLGLVPLWPQGRTELFVGVLIISGLIAHAPARVRYFSVWHRCQVERLGPFDLP